MLRSDRRLAQPPLGDPGRRRAAPPPAPVRGRRDPLGNDAAAADARRASRDRDPVGDPLHPRARRRAREARREPRADARAAHLPPPLGRLPDRARRAGRRAGRSSIRSPGPTPSAPSTRLYAEKQGKPGARWGDKTPGYIKSMREIQVYLPEARFIHLIRDGRDVALSVLKQDWGPQTIEAAAEKWRSRVLRGRSQQPYLGFYMEVKFEDLVLHTERELRRICEFIELDFDPAHARLPRDRRAAAAGEGARAPARPRRGAVGREAAGEPREDLRAAEPRPDRHLAARRCPPRTAPPTRRSPATCSPTSATSSTSPDDGEVHMPRRGPAAAAAAAPARSRRQAGDRDPRAGRGRATPAPS